MSSREFCSQFEQNWPTALEIPADAPQPWLVMGDAAAIRCVMRSDYFSPPRSGLRWQTATGYVTQVSHSNHVRGCRDGTLFVLPHPAGWTTEMKRIAEEAVVYGFAIRDLPTKRGEQS